MTRRTTLARTHAKTVLSLSALALLITGAVLYAGPLDPPAGPLTSTYKTLTEVEPRIAINATNTPGDADSRFKITLPGSYYLTGNITGVVGKHGIEIAASGVTLDLNGFDLAGIAGSLDGVTASAANLSNITILNGSIRNWGSDGVSLSVAGITNCRVEGVLAIGNGGFGIFVASSCLIANCSAVSNTNNGISTGASCRVWNCVGASNGGSGITIGVGSSVSGCVAKSNTLDGIRCVSSCLVLSNACDSNGSGGDGAGIHATGADNRIEGNNCANADRGIDVDIAGNIIIKNTCSGNSTNWTIVANNVYGAIVDRTAPASPAVNSNSATATTGTSDPNANITY